MVSTTTWTRESKHEALQAVLRGFVRSGALSHHDGWEGLLTEAVMLQHEDYIDRLVIVDAGRFNLGIASLLSLAERPVV